MNDKFLDGVSYFGLHELLRSQANLVFPKRSYNLASSCFMNNKMKSKMINVDTSLRHANYSAARSAIVRV